MIDILRKIEKLRLDRNWSEYELSKYAEIPQSTISSWYRKNQVPALTSLDKLCKAFDITLSMLVADEDDCVELSSEDKEALRLFHCLSSNQKETLLQFLAALSESSEVKE